MVIKINCTFFQPFLFTVLFYFKVDAFKRKKRLVFATIFVGDTNNTDGSDAGVLAGVRVINPDGAYIYHQDIEGFPDYIEDFSRDCSNNTVNLTFNNFRIRNQSSKNTFTIQLHYDNNASVLTSSLGTLVTVGADGEPLAGTYNLDLLVSLL